MNILLIGTFTYSWNTEVHLQKSLESMGHLVTPLQESSVMPGVIMQVAINHRIDMMLFMVTHHGFVTLYDLEQLRKHGIISVYFTGDLIAGLPDRLAGIELNPCWKSDYVFGADGSADAMELFKSKGVNYYWLKNAVFDRECKEGRVQNEFRANVAFIGKAYRYHEAWPYRSELMIFLREKYGGWFSIWGPPFKVVRDDDLNDVCASTKIIIGDSLCPDFKYENYWSDRIYETTGRGGFIIHPYVKGLEKDFVDKKEVVYYEFGNFEQLKNLIDYYLEHDEEREAIRRAGKKRAIAEHTYKHRMEEMLEVVYED